MTDTERRSGNSKLVYDKEKRTIVTVRTPELDHAILLANKVLDRINADPDDDLAVLARQFLRRAGWQPITGEMKRRVLVTNNVSAVDAHGVTSHVWVAEMIHDDREGETNGFMCFDGNGFRKVWGLTHYAEIPAPMLKDVPRDEGDGSYGSRYHHRRAERADNNTPSSRGE